MRIRGSTVDMPRLATFGLFTAVATLPFAHVLAEAPTLARAAELVTDAEGRLFDFETVQLTDRVLADLATRGVPNASLFSFQSDTPSDANKHQSGQCKTYPGDVSWPSDPIWDLFNVLLDGALIKTIPDTAICYSNWSVYDASKCQNLTVNYADSYLR
jgi:hypothetical protein